MVEGCRQHVREDVDAVYYFRSDMEDDQDEAGWYLENAENRQRISGPYDYFVIAEKAANEVPTGGPCHLGPN